MTRRNGGGGRSWIPLRYRKIFSIHACTRVVRCGGGGGVMVMVMVVVCSHREGEKDAADYGAAMEGVERREPAFVVDHPHLVTSPTRPSRRSAARACRKVAIRENGTFGKGAVFLPGRKAKI